VSLQTLIPSGNNENLYTSYYLPGVYKNGMTGTNVFVGPVYDIGDISTTGSGTIANAYGGPYCNGYGSWATNMWCYYEVGPAPNKFSGPLVVGGSAAGLSGTGACATITTHLGGAWGGSFKCTGATGVSTAVITPGFTSPNGWACSSSDITTPNALRQSATTGTTCTLSGAVNSNDVLTFTAIAF
jgi:hypothetical protein